MNRVWAIKAQAQLTQLATKAKAIETQLAEALERIKALEEKRLGRPPKEKTE